MSEYTQAEVQELFTENLKRAVSLCEDLEKLTRYRSWKDFAANLAILRQWGERLYNSPSMSKAETNRQLDAHVARMVANNEVIH